MTSQPGGVTSATQGRGRGMSTRRECTIIHILMTIQPLPCEAFIVTSSPLQAYSFCMQN
jgi:hypothetical protein